MSYKDKFFKRGKPQTYSDYDEVKGRGSNSECWRWIGSKEQDGYGRMSINTHQLAYILQFGDIPHECDIHHSCGNRDCINPTHLLAIPHNEHLRMPKTKKKCCGRGHEFTKGNTYWWRGQRSCKTCRKEVQKRMNII